MIVAGAGKLICDGQGNKDQIGTCLPGGLDQCSRWNAIITPGITTHPARPAGLNEPTEAVYTNSKIIELVNSAGPRDLCIALISGGGAFWHLLNITLTDKLEVTRFLTGGR